MIYRCEKCGIFGHDPRQLHMCVTGYASFKEATPIPGVSKQ